MRIHCPNCYAEFPLEAALDDQAGRELMAVLSELPVEIARPLVAYIGLFRPRTRRLSWDRALRLVRDVEQLRANPGHIAAALAETVEAMREKQQAGDWRPLKNHAYLERVLESVQQRPAATVTRDDKQDRPARRGRTAQGLEHLEGQRRG